MCLLELVEPNLSLIIRPCLICFGGIYVNVSAHIWYPVNAYLERLASTNSPKFTGWEFRCCISIYIIVCENKDIPYRNVPIRSALPNRSAPKLVFKLSQNSSPSPQRIQAPGASNKNLRESMHNKYIVQAPLMLLKITMAATTTCFTSVGFHKLQCVSNTPQAPPVKQKWHRIEAPSAVS